LKDAGAYITELLKSEHDAPEWQATTERSQHWTRSIGNASLPNRSKTHSQGKNEIKEKPAS
jgi:hypothetical protein